MKAALAMLACAWLAGCGGGTPPPTPPQVGDPQLEKAERVARLAFDQRQLDQAAVLTRGALNKAYARDDLGAIADSGYNLAVIELRRGKAAEAAALARNVQAEITRRGQAPFDALRLVEAMALYRAGETADAAPIAAALSGSGQAEIAARAWFLRGLLAAGQGDAAGINAAIAALGANTNAELRADREELNGHRARLAGDGAAMRQAWLTAANLRRDALDYAGMARVLVLTAEAAQAGGDAAEAADLYLRAGRSAAAQGANADARKWLGEAARLGSPDIAADARARLATLKEP